MVLRKLVMVLKNIIQCIVCSELLQALSDKDITVFVRGRLNNFWNPKHELGIYFIQFNISLSHNSVFETYTKFGNFESVA